MIDNARITDLERKVASLQAAITADRIKAIPALERTPQQIEDLAIAYAIERLTGDYRNSPPTLENLKLAAHNSHGFDDSVRERAWSQYHHALQAAYEGGRLVERGDDK